MQHEPEFYGLMDVEWLSLPWGWIGLITVVAAIWIGIVWVAWSLEAER